MFLSVKSRHAARGRLAAGACLALASCAAPVPPGVTEGVATTPLAAPAAAAAATAATAATASAPPAPSDSVAPAPPGPPPALVVERHACRSVAPAYRLAIVEGGAVTFVGERNVLARRAQAHVDPAAVRAVVDRALAAGVDRWGHLSCEPTGGARCSMHPCRTTIAVTRDGVTHVASRTDGAPGSGAAFAAVATDVERLARRWRWVDATVEPGAGSPCATSHDCTVRADRCGQLHATRLADTSPLEATTCTSGWPTSRVEPVCVESRCAMAPVDDDSRACRSSAECVAVRIGCEGAGAIRRDRVRGLAVRNDHLPCTDAGPPLPAAACLHGVCVTR